MGHGKPSTCDAYAAQLRAGEAANRFVTADFNNTAGIGDRIKALLTLASLASTVSAAVSVAPPCSVLATSHLCRVQAQAAFVPDACNGTHKPSLPCEWAWSRYVELRPAALASDELRARQLPQSHRVGPTQGGDVAVARQHYHTVRERSGPLHWRVSNTMASPLLEYIDEPRCVPAAVPGAPVRALRDRFVAAHRLRASGEAAAAGERHYHAFHIRRMGCAASAADVEGLAEQLSNTSAPAAPGTPVRTLLLFTDEPASPFFPVATAVLARRFEVLRLDEQLAAWQRETDGVEDNYLVYLAELLIATGAAANGHVYRCKGAECPACRIDINRHPGGIRGWSFADP